MSGILWTFSSILLLTKCLVINGCVVDDVRCVMKHDIKYRTHQTYHHVQSGEKCQERCTATRERDTKINYFTYDAAHEECRCTGNCLIDREESAKGEVAGLVSDQDPSELCVTESDVEEEADAFISVLDSGLVQIHPLSEDSYCNNQANREAAKFTVSKYEEKNRRAMFFNNDEVVSCGSSRGCDAYNIVPEITGHSSFGFKTSLVNISSVTVFNGNTWLLGGIEKHTNEPSMKTYLYLSNTQLLGTDVEMPQPMTMSCSAQISDSQYFLVDGLSGDCFIYDTEQRGWISIPGLLSPKSEEVLCAVAYNNGDPVVIVDGWMGGQGKDEPSQIFHVASQTWTFAPGETNYVIPYHSAILPLGNSVISVGGFVIDETGERVMNSWVRMYDLKTGNWVKRGPELEDPNGGAVHLLVSKSLELCKPKK